MSSIFQAALSRANENTVNDCPCGMPIPPDWNSPYFCSDTCQRLFVSAQANVPSPGNCGAEEMDLVQAPPRLLAYRGKRVAWVYRRRRWPFWHLTLHPVDAIRPVAHRELPVGEERRAQGLWREMEAELAGLIGRRHEVGP